MAAPNLTTASSHIGKTAIQAISTSATAIISNATGSNKLMRVISLNIANIHATNNADITVDFFRSAAATNVAKAVTVPLKTSLVVIQKDNPINLEEGDSLRLAASATASLEAVCSYEEITQ